MKKMTNFVSLFAVGASFSVFADPTVQSVNMAQADDRTVTITYTLENEPAVVTLDIVTNGVSIGGENIQYVTGDVNKKVSGKEIYTITWRPDFSWQGNLADAQAVVMAWPLDNTPDYMVVDLTAASTADNVRYYASTNFFPGGLMENRKYRTTSIVMRKILAKGVTWWMGSVDGDGGRTTGSKEVRHQVTLTNNYYIGVFEVTQTQWTLVQTARKDAARFTMSAYKAMRPEENVSYNEIRMAANSTSANANAKEWPDPPYTGSYLNLLRVKTGIDFDLPSDAEWEYACRAGHGDKEWNNGVGYTSSTLGDTAPGRHNLNGGAQATVDNYGYANCPDTVGTAICGSYAPNDWGLYDMHGNVGEWCLDWYQESLAGTDGSVITTGSSNRVRRSGLGSDGAVHLRSAARTGNDPTLQHQFIGFRLACRAGLK